MPSMPTLPSDFQLVFDAALSNYSKQTGINLATYPYAQDIQACRSADDLFNVLQDRARQFQAYRDGNHKLINCLKPVLQILHTVSGILRDPTAPVSSSLQRDPFCLITLFTPLAPGAVPTYNSNNCWNRCSSYRMCLTSRLRRRPHNISVI